MSKKRVFRDYKLIHVKFFGFVKLWNQALSLLKQGYNAWRTLKIWSKRSSFFKLRSKTSNTDSAQQVLNGPGSAKLKYHCITNNCNTITTNNSYSNDLEIPSLNNTHPEPPWYDISTTSDTATNSDNGRSINVIQAFQYFNQKSTTWAEITKRCPVKEYQRLHSEKNRLEEKPETYPPNSCVLMGGSILNGVIGRNLSNDWSV